MALDRSTIAGIANMYADEARRRAEEARVTLYSFPERAKEAAAAQGASAACTRIAIVARLMLVLPTDASTAMRLVDSGAEE